MTGSPSFKIAITAIGGQGGGVLAGWIVKLGERSGYIAQSTSVPGVAQRTGATVYYVELFSEDAARSKGKSPVLALMPVPGDVDIVIAAELMEAGRAVMRGFVTQQTTLIASSHRDYAIAEKITMSDGRQDADSIQSAAEKSAGRFIQANMAEAAASANAVISAVLFGVLAGSGALPINRENFEATIRAAGHSVESNLRGFEKGFSIAESASLLEERSPAEKSIDGQPSPSVIPLLDRLKDGFPPATHFILKEGLKRTVDFQDVKYAHLYLDHLEKILTADCANGGEAKNWRLTQATGKHLALWMTYDDAIRVADLKTRANRFVRFREDVCAEENQIVHVSEYLHPRVEEVCDILPAGGSSVILKSATLKKSIGAVLGKGKRVSTTKLRGFLMLRFMASLRFARRASYRFKLEEQRSNDWLELILSLTPRNYELACEVAALQRLIKGYGDTRERGLANYKHIIAVIERVKTQADPENVLSRLCDAALHDENGASLHAAIDRLQYELNAAE